MKYKVLIRCIATGEERWHEPSYSWGEGSVWAWTEGNFGCDCNRGILFGADDNDACGDMLRYTIPYAEFEDGTRIEIDSQRL